VLGKNTPPLQGFRRGKQACCPFQRGEFFQNVGGRVLGLMLPSKPLPDTTLVHVPAVSPSLLCQEQHGSTIEFETLARLHATLHLILATENVALPTKRPELPTFEMQKLVPLFDLLLRFFSEVGAIMHVCCATISQLLIIFGDIAKGKQRREEAGATLRN
jgi:hypothetical protein